MLFVLNCASSPAFFCVWLLRCTTTKPQREIGVTTAAYLKTSVCISGTSPPPIVHVNKKYNIRTIINLRLEIVAFDVSSLG